MAQGIFKWFRKRFPQNYILRKPYIGAVLFLAFSFGFLSLYKPLQIHGSRSLSLELTILVYCIIMSIYVAGSGKLIKYFPFFSNEDDWTILKEILSIVIVLCGMGIVVYFAGFLIEVPDNRWNFSTFSDSCLITFLIGIIPFGFFTLINYRYVLFPDMEQHYDPGKDRVHQEKPEDLVHIESQLKKEEVSFYPSQLIYAESEGNYVVFHLDKDGRLSKKMVRNSISNVEQQLSAIPFILRTHRAFMVNLKKVHSKKGNTLGYQLKMSGSDAEIPVSRQNTRNFNRIISQNQ